MTLLLTMTSGSVASLLKGATPADLHTVPDLAMSQLGLRGLNIDAAQLAGFTPADLQTMRDQADKAACPCLVLVDRNMLAFGQDDAAGAVDRVSRLAAAADRLGCNAVAITTSISEAQQDQAVEQLQTAMRAVEARELNLLLTVGEGLASTPDGLIDVVKAEGGFRIGMLPVYGDGDDPVEHLRRLAPYAGAVHVRVEGFNTKGAHKGADLAEGVQTLKRVGYQNTVAIEFTGTTKAEASIQLARTQLQEAIDAEDGA